MFRLKKINVRKINASLKNLSCFPCWFFPWSKMLIFDSAWKYLLFFPFDPYGNLSSFRRDAMVETIWTFYTDQSNDSTCAFHYSAPNTSFSLPGKYFKWWFQRRGKSFSVFLTFNCNMGKITNAHSCQYFTLRIMREPTLSSVLSTFLLCLYKM